VPLVLVEEGRHVKVPLARYASVSGLKPDMFGGRSGSAPHWMRAMTADRCPSDAAQPRGSLSNHACILAFGSWPAAQSCLMVSASPRIAARCSGHAIAQPMLSNQP